MFKGKTFYHSHVRKAVAAFGSIFNNIVIQRKDSSGNVAQSLRVPLAYATKQKFLSRIEGQPNLTDQEVALVLPRMGFEISSLTYDPTRKVAPIQQHRKTNTSDALKMKQSFVSTPYDLNLTLYCFAKNQEDGLQIIEQILPFFNPDFNITVNDLPELGIKRDIKITLESIAYEDNTYGQFADRQSIIWSLNFTMKLNFYGHVADQGIIRKVIADVYQNPNLTGERTRQQYSVTSATATGTATLSGNAVNAIAVTYSGGNYTSAGPNITITGDGTGARASVTMEADPLNSSKFRVKSVTIDAGGSGYSSAPTVTFEAPDSGIQSIDDAYRFLEEFDTVYE